MSKSNLNKELHMERNSLLSLFKMIHCYSHNFLQKRKVEELAVLSVEIKAAKFYSIKK